MTQSWTFGKKLAAGFVAVLVLLLVVSAIGTFALQKVVAAKDQVLDVQAKNLLRAERLRATAARKSSAARGYLITGDARALEQMKAERESFGDLVAQLATAANSDQNQSLVQAIAKDDAALQKALDEVLVQRKNDRQLAVLNLALDEKVLPRRDALERDVAAFIALEERLLEQRKHEATVSALAARNRVVSVSAVALLLAVGVALVLTRGLSRQIGSAVQHIQSSSSELQTAVNQQSTGTREQATALSEITTTINELLVTSKQIAQSAQRVAQFAEDTAHSATAGEQVVSTTQEAIAGIQAQVGLIVTHMLELGKKSQQIGGILEIIGELAEQTNILAINAAIEAAGAGEAGRRFGVVAEEIRKLADRVGGSTKDIRGLIDEIRAAVNKTVMTTEGGTKAVEAGARQFGQVTVALQRIAELVGTTTEATREIELSTKQQSTAVEQVNLAVSNVAQATRETESSASQTLQTATMLGQLSRDLLRLIQPDAGR